MDRLILATRKLADELGLDEVKRAQRNLPTARSSSASPWAGSSAGTPPTCELPRRPGHGSCDRKSEGSSAYRCGPGGRTRRVPVHRRPAYVTPWVCRRRRSAAPSGFSIPSRRKSKDMVADTESGFSGVPSGLQKIRSRPRIAGIPSTRTPSVLVLLKLRPSLVWVSDRVIGAPARPKRTVAALQISP